MKLLEDRTPQIPPKVWSEVANFVLAYCITGVFLLKNKGVRFDAGHFNQLLQNYYGRNLTTVNFDSQETASTTYDQISLRTPISVEAKHYIMKHIVGQSDSGVFLVHNLIQFVNRDATFNSLVSSVTNNGLLNRVVVDIDNMSAESPASTSILVDNEQVNVFKNYRPIYDFRTGIGNIGQKELNKDYGYQVHRSFIKKSLGIDIGDSSSVYYQQADNNGNPTVESMESATRTLYQEVCRRINDGFQSIPNPLKDFKGSVTSSMLSCCYGVDCESDETCLMIRSAQEGCKTFEVPEALDTLNGTDLVASCPSHINPSIRIMDKNKNELFQLRFKKERYKENVTGHRYKLYFTPIKFENML